MRTRSQCEYSMGDCQICTFEPDLTLGISSDWDRPYQTERVAMGALHCQSLCSGRDFATQPEKCRVRSN